VTPIRVHRQHVRLHIAFAAGAGYTAVDPESRRIVPTDAERQGKTVVKMVYVVLEAQYQVGSSVQAALSTGCDMSSNWRNGGGCSTGGGHRAMCCESHSTYKALPNALSQHDTFKVPPLSVGLMPAGFPDGGCAQHQRAQQAHGRGAGALLQCPCPVECSGIATCRHRVLLMSMCFVSR
jgi:hypothetical protein